MNAMERDKSESRRPEAFAGLPSPSVIAPKDWPQVVDKNVGEAIQAFRETQDRSYKIERSHTHTDKGILLVLAIALLGSLSYMFYLIHLDKLEAVTNFVYPIVALVLGFMSGYFAGSGRGRGRRH
jgi:hypothetical protein